MFHKGYGELTAEDVKFSLEKAANKTTSSFAADYAALDKVEAIDQYTVRITFKHAIPSVLGILTNYHGGYVVSKKAVLEKGDKFKFDPIGTGPFMLKEYLPKEKVEAVRHPDYFRGKSKLDRIELWFMLSASSRETAFRKGEIDIVEGEREQAWVNKMRGIPGTAIETFGPGETLVLHFNRTKKPLDDIRVRRAICHAINPDELMKFLSRDLTERLFSPVPVNYLGGTDKVPRYEFNPEKAKKLMAEAGYPKGFEMSMVITEMSDYLRPMEEIQEQLRRVGVHIKMDVVTHTAFHQQIRKNVNPLVLYICARFPTADPVLTQFYHSKSIVGSPSAITNFSHYNQIDDLIKKARLEVDLRKQKALWAEAQERIIEDAVALPLCITKFVFARKTYVDLGYEMRSSLTLGTPMKEITDIRK
jgi:peptide/nickel transport system substrate-binding protein